MPALLGSAGCAGRGSDGEDGGRGGRREADSGKQRRAKGDQRVGGECGSEGPSGSGNAGVKTGVETGSERAVCMEARKSFVCVACMHTCLCNVCAGPSPPLESFDPAILALCCRALTAARVSSASCRHCGRAHAAVPRSVSYASTPLFLFAEQALTRLAWATSVPRCHRADSSRLFLTCRQRFGFQ